MTTLLRTTTCLDIPSSSEVEDEREMHLGWDQMLEGSGARVGSALLSPGWDWEKDRRPLGVGGGTTLVEEPRLCIHPDCWIPVLWLCDFPLFHLHFT